MNWDEEELDKIDQEIRKLSNIHTGFHQRFSADKLYTPRTQRCRRLLTVKECVELERSNERMKDRQYGK